MGSKQRVAADDFEAFFRAEYARMVAVLAVVSGRREDAADAVQAAFAEAHLRWDQVRGFDDPAAWVRRVARNRVIDEVRRSARHDRLHRLLPRHGDVGPPEASELTDAIRSLPDGQRVAVALHYFDDLPIAEVADLLGVATGTVKSQLAAARRRLARTKQLRTCDD